MNAPSDELLLYLIALALYLGETLLWLPRGTLLLRTGLRRGWRSSEATPGNRRGGFAPASPLPWQQNAFLCAHLPIALAPEGVANHPLQSLNRPELPPLRAIRYDALETIALKDETTLFLNGEAFATCHSREQARALRDLLDHLRLAPAERRPALLDRFFLQRYRAPSLSLSTPLHLWNSVALAISFLLAPLAYLWYPSALTLLAGLITTLFCAIISTVLFARLHRRDQPGASDFRHKTVLRSLLCFPTAFATTKDLHLHRFPNTEPLALGEKLLCKNQFRELATTLWRDLIHPLTEEESGFLRAARTLEQRHTARFLSRHGITPESLDTPPEEIPHGSLCYCPRCHATFLNEPEQCPDCPGVTPQPCP